MSLFSKFKDLFQHDPAFEAEKRPDKKENYLENKETALNIICSHMARYAYSADRNLAVLHLWVIAPESDSQVAWADDNFLKELKARLRQDMIEGVKRIDLKTVTRAEFQKIHEENAAIKAMDEGRLYFLTTAEGPAGDAQSSHKAATAWLVCVAGQENMTSGIVRLDPKGKTVWHIGRSENPSLVVHNDVVIKDECLQVSRQHAAIVLDDGDYYLQCKRGGCRAQGGQLTRILRADGRQEELMLLSHRGTACLREGDFIQLSKEAVYLKFTFLEPEKH